MIELNKYYTPDISDLFVGYECDVYFCNKVQDTLMSPALDDVSFYWNKDFVDNLKNRSHVYDWIKEKDWESGKLSSGILDRIVGDWYNTQSIIRTSYLTVEDILSEGFIFVIESSINYLFSKGESLVYLHKNKIPYIEVYPYEGYDTQYQGECPSINEFRKICKLMKI
jgi:hypothetical protein